MASTFNEVDPSTLPERFNAFHIVTVPYKTITHPEDHQITTSILIPKALLASPSETTSAGTAAAATLTARPLLIRVHGGGFVTGSSLFAPFFAVAWTDLAERERAVTVCPNHRMLPESPIEDALADIADHWVWVQQHLDDLLARETAGRVSADLNRVMIGGESAGGYLAFMQALSEPSSVRSIIASYPMVDIKDRFFTQQYVKEMWDLPQLPNSVYEDHVAGVRDGKTPKVVSADPSVARKALTTAMIQQGRFAAFFPEHKRELFVLDRIADGARFPKGKILIWHGRADQVVPVQGSIKLRDLMERVDPEARFELILEDGNHGYEVERSLDEWEPQGLKDAVADWLR